MSLALNGNTNGSATTTVVEEPRKLTINETFVSFVTPDKVESRGTLLRMTRYSAVFEIYNPQMVLQVSEALAKFNINFNGVVIYSGRAVIQTLVDAGPKVICEANLDEAQWTTVPLGGGANTHKQIALKFNDFLGEWQKFYTVSSEFKVVVADMQTFLHNLQLWLNQFEIELRLLAASERKHAEQQFLHECGRLFVPAFDMLHERLEALSQKIGPDLRPAHRAYIQRQLHPLMLCSPFGHRAYAKPLGYAGDYEMVNMIAMDPYQGSSLFAKMVNLWFLSQWPSKAHRNRLAYLGAILENETLRAHRNKREAKIFNFACGPALEIQNFLAKFGPSSHTSVTLSDFNQETLERIASILNDTKSRLGRKTRINYVKKSVYQLFKEVHKLGAEKSKYDLVYCAGLFDYLPDNTCAQLMEIFYDWLAPGGLLAVTNVVDDKPFRHMLEFILDWHLIYRNVEDTGSIFPDSIPLDVRQIKKDSTGVNIFIEARKPCE